MKRVFWVLLTFTLVLCALNMTYISASADDLSFKEKKEMLHEVAVSYNIPPEILKAIAFKDSV